jgi:hypothetical protein
MKGPRLTALLLALAVLGAGTACQARGYAMPVETAQSAPGEAR